MNSFVFFDDEDVLLSVKTDLLDNLNDGFTILEISGKTDETVALGLPNQQTFSNVQEFVTLAENANVNLQRFKDNGDVIDLFEIVV